MNMLMRWLEDAQAINVEKKGVSYSEEAFTQLYEEALKFNENRKIELRIATGKGALIGAASVGLVALSIKGINKFRKRNSKDERLEPEELEAMGIKTFKPEVMEINDNHEEFKEMPRKNRKALANIITEINENGKVH